MLDQALTPGRLIALRLADGTPMAGRVVALDGAWLHLHDLDGGHLLNLAQVAMVHLDQGGRDDGQTVAADGALPRPRSNDQPRKVGSRAPGRPWDETELKRLSEAFLDNASDGELALRFHRTRAQITELHRGFECARGNLNEDDLSPAAVLWVERWRRVLAG